MEMIELLKVVFYNSTRDLFRNYPVNPSLFDEIWDFDCSEEHDILECDCQCTVSSDESEMIWVLIWRVDDVIYTDLLAWPGDHCCGICVSSDLTHSVPVDVGMKPEDTDLKWEPALITARRQIIVGPADSPFAVIFNALKQTELSAPLRQTELSALAKAN